MASGRRDARLDEAAPPGLFLEERQAKAISALEMKERGMSIERISENAEYLSPYPSSFKEKGIRRKELPIITKAMKNYSLDDTKRIILYLGEMDSAVKSAQSEMLYIVLSDIIFTICSDKITNKGEIIRKNFQVIHFNCLNVLRSQTSLRAHILDGKFKV